MTADDPSDLTDDDMDRAASTAARMVRMYADSAYRPADRAEAHARAYDSTEWRYHWWLAVATAIREIEK